VRAGPALGFFLVTAVTGAAWIARVTLLKRPEVSPGGIRFVAISRSGRWAGSGTGNGRIRIHDMQGHLAVRAIIADQGALNDLQFSPDERYLAVANRNLTLFTLADGQPSRRLREDFANYGASRFSNDGRAILTITGSGQIMVLGLKNGEADFSVCCSTIYGDVAFLERDQKVVSAGHWPAIWDRKAGVAGLRLTPARVEMTFGPIAITQAGDQVYLGSQDGRVHRWDLRTRSFLDTSPALSGYVTSIAVLNENWIAFSSTGVVQLWNPATGESRRVQEAKPSSNLWFDASTGLTVFGKESGEIEYWDLLAAKRVKIISPDSPPRA
jgi:WD40 repeat protein